ncbi:hypothetical protein Bca52824_085667 [Brassica carinata]|uniref:C2H2-type domain-containing protein n=1 Tax=Brassica carinata TaxID=52824 RepID=A0A8X7PA18_BRACI|nr:hypothetical protein Bca52824_085667 [Brassica carinata]
MTSRLRKKRRLGREERETSINKTGIEPQCKAAVVIEKSAARSQNPDSPVEETANHRSQKPAILVELTDWSSWVTEELFEARQSALAVEKSKSDEAPTLYTCRVCGKGYKSSKAHEQHLKSLSHVLRFSQGATNNGDEDVAIVTPLPRRFKNKDNKESDDE